MNTDFEYTQEYYTKLEENARSEVIDDIQVSVFRGQLTKLFRGMGISHSYYSKVMDALKELGCITVIQRGARGVDSVVVLNHPPDEMEFLIHRRQPLTSSPQAATLVARLEKLETMIGGLNVVDAVQNLDGRLKELEREAQDGRH